LNFVGTDRFKHENYAHVVAREEASVTRALRRRDSLIYEAQKHFLCGRLKTLDLREKAIINPDVAGRFLIEFQAIGLYGRHPSSCFPASVPRGRLSVEDGVPAVTIQVERRSRLATG
jgi:hypothetical protein